MDKITSNLGNVDQIQVAVDVITNQLNSTNTKVDGLNNQVGNINGKINENSGNIQKLEGKVDSNEGQIADVGAKISEVDKAVEANAKRIGQNENDIEENNEMNSSNKDKLSEYGAKIGSNMEALGQNQLMIESIKKSVVENTVKVNTTIQRLDQNEGKIATAIDKIDQHEEDLTNLQTNLDATNTMLDDTKVLVGQQEDMIEKSQNKVMFVATHGFTNPALHGWIAYGKANTNNGDGLNIASGKFCAPISGSYWFTFEAMANQTVHFYKNNSVEASYDRPSIYTPASLSRLNPQPVKYRARGKPSSIGAYRSDGDTLEKGPLNIPVTRSWMLQLNKGDIVRIRLEPIYKRGNTYEPIFNTSFSGYLVNPSSAKECDDDRYYGPNCDECFPGYFGYPDCKSK